MGNQDAILMKVQINNFRTHLAMAIDGCSEEWLGGAMEILNSRIMQMASPEILETLLDEYTSVQAQLI